MSGDPVFFATIKTFGAQIQNADASNLISLYTAPSNGGKIEALAGTSNDTSAREVSLVVSKGGTDFVIGTVSIPASSGNANANPAVDMLNVTNCPWLRTDENGNRCLFLDFGCVLKVKSLTTVTAAKAVQLFGYGREV